MKTLLNRSFQRGLVAGIAIVMILLDFLGKGTYLKLLEHPGVNTTWWIWLLLYAAMKVWQIRDETRTRSVDEALVRDFFESGRYQEELKKRTGKSD